jgi:hypothetical protein
MSPIVAEMHVSPIAAEITPTDIKGMSPPYSPQILLDRRSAKKKVQS